MKPAPAHAAACCAETRARSQQVRRLQLFTLAWMLAECDVALFAAWRAHSPALLAFGADSLIELLSAAAVLAHFSGEVPQRQRLATSVTGALLFVLAGVIVLVSTLALIDHVQPEGSWLGVGVAIAALVVMPLLSAAKARAAAQTGNAALRADAVQSATCAYLAGITLVGLTARALLHVAWIDPAAALLAVPILCLEGRNALRGRHCC